MEIATDITRRKQTEEQLRIITTDLEELVAARTKQLRTLSAQLTMTEERERRTLAQDLHDSLGQTLAVLKIKLSALSWAGAQSAREELALLVDRAELEARNAIQTLSPPILRTLGLVAALEWLAEEIHYTYGLTVLLNCTGQGHILKEEIQAVLYRAARELLINAAKHARIQRVSLTCLCDQTDLTIMVSDDGCGFDPEARDSAHEKRGFGLASVRERLCNLGGEMEIDSSPGRGTTVRLSLPLAVAEEGHTP
jgi:signal transduction histidine kinase